MSKEAVGMILPRCYLVRCKKDDVLYSHGEKSDDCAYIIIYGFIDLIDGESKNKFGGLAAGDSLGEEALLYEKKDLPR